MNRRLPYLAGLLLAACVTGCAHFQSAPISPSQNTTLLESRTLNEPGLKDFLERHAAPPASWPVQQWSFDRLVLAALYFHPNLDLARAHWQVAKAAEITAGGRPNPTASIGPQYNINAARGVTPWLAFMDFEIPIETAGKRGYRMAQARHRSQAARLEIISVAWQVRAKLRDALLDVAAAQRRLESLRNQVALQEQALKRLEQKLAAGALASSEVLPQRIALQKSRLEVADAERARLEARAQVAAALSLSLAAVDSMELPAAGPGLAAVAPRLASAEARQTALHSRADILAALAGYEASQAGLQLEIAKQYPDLKIGPGYEYDQGENKFGFNLGLELPLLNRNQGPIAEAEAKRREAAAGVMALQTKILGDIETALAGVRATTQQLAAADALIAAQEQQKAKLQQQAAAGAVEALDLLNADLELAIARLARLDIQLKHEHALAQLEDAIQSPLTVDCTLDPRTSPGKETTNPSLQHE